MQALALVLALFASACAGSRSQGRTAQPLGDAYRVEVTPHAVRGEGAAEFERALTAALRRLALPVRGDGRLAVAAERLLPDAPATEVERVVGPLGLMDGRLSVHALERESDQAWESALAELERAVIEIRPTHYGARLLDTRHARVVLSTRPTVFSPVPRKLPAGSPIVLRGRLPGGSGKPVMEVVSPDGAYRALPAGGGPDFEVQVESPLEGTYRVTVRGDTRGPVARLSVDVGRASSGEDLRVARALPPADGFYSEIGRLRRVAGLRVLDVAPQLERVAMGQAALAGQLVLQGAVRAPDGAGLRAAMATDPGCRAAISQPEVSHVGVHIERAETGLRLTLVTARFAQTGASELTAARLLQGLNQTRRARGGSPLAPDARLGEIARRVATAHLRGELVTEQEMVDAGNAQLQRLSLAFRRVATVVALVSDPAEAFALEPALDPGASAVGVGVAQRSAALRAEGRSVAVVMALGWAR